MKNIVFLFCSLLFNFQLQLFSQAPSGFYIINGEEIEINEAPWQVSLEIDGKHQCGGAILNQYWILTAAHCVNNPTSLCTNDVVVHAGSTDQTNNLEGQRIPASRIIPLILGNGDFSVYNEDIALIQLSSPLSFNSDVQPISFAQSGTVLFGTGLLTGWGDTGSGISDVLMKTEIPLISNFEFLDIIDLYPGCDSYRDYISSNMIVFSSTQSSIGGEIVEVLRF